MIVGIFKTIGLRAYITSFTFSFLVIGFTQFCKNGADISLISVVDTFIYLILFFSITLYATFLQSVKSSSKLEAIHLLIFPFTFLFFPIGPVLSIYKIFIVVILVYTQHLFTRPMNEGLNSKYIFDMSVAISLLFILNNVLAIFYLIPIWTIFKNKLMSRRNILALFGPMFLIPFTLNELYFFFTSKLLFRFQNNVKIIIWNFETHTIDEKIWLFLLLFSFTISILQKPRGHERFSYKERSNEFLFMSFWLYISIIIGFFNLQIEDGRWLLSFIPVAYFFGVFIEKIKHNFLKDLFIFIGLIMIVFFKLFDIGILAL